MFELKLSGWLLIIGVFILDWAFKYIEFKCKFKYEYLKKYMDFTYHETYNVFREERQQKIIDEYFVNKKKQRNKRIIFTAGCYGVGKGRVMKHLEKMGNINLNDYVYVDQDKIREKLPEYKDYIKEDCFTAGFKTNKESGYISELIQRHAFEMNYNVIIDSSLQDIEWHLEYVQWIKSKYPFYEIVIIYVTAGWSKILERNIKRGEKTKRMIPLEHLKSTYSRMPNSFQLFQNYATKSYIIDNDSDYSYNKTNINLTNNINSKNLDFNCNH